MAACPDPLGGLVGLPWGSARIHITAVTENCAHGRPLSEDDD
jgi:hypothetical protein